MGAAGGASFFCKIPVISAKFCLTELSIAFFERNATILSFYGIFSIIGEEVLGPCFDHALYLAASNQDTLMPSNYLKSDVNYYKMF